MIKLFVSVLIYFNIAILCSQNFGGENAQWVYNYRNAFKEGITIIEYIGDTTIETKLLNKYSKMAYRRNFNSKDIFKYVLDPIFTRFTNGVVEYSDDGFVFDTLYNFNAKIGDTWIFFGHGFGEGDSVSVTVIDTFRTIISNVAVLTQKIEWTYYLNGGERKLEDTIYYNIGARWTYINPFDWMSVAGDGGEGGILRCFKNDELGVVPFYSIYQSNYEYDCDKLSGTDSYQQTVLDFRIVTNPILNDLIIESNQHLISKMNLIDISGRFVAASDIQYGNNIIDVIRLPPGYYIVLIDNHIVGKIVK